MAWRVMVHLILAFVACMAVALHPLASHAQMKPFPRCLAGFCLEAGNLPTEQAVRSRFGGSKQPVFLRDFVYCYRFVSPRKTIYGYFMLSDLHSGSESELWVVRIRLSKEPLRLCASAHTVTIKTMARLSTKEGIHLNSSEADVLKQYGKPRYASRPPPPEVVRDFLGDSPKTTIDAINLYVIDDDLSSARFYISRGHVVGIEVSFGP